MSRFETDTKKQLKYFPRIWLRYVDDIFAVFDTKETNLENFISELYNMFPSIKFAHEIENNERLPFLDVLVIRKNNILEFDIYRKDTSVGFCRPYIVDGAVVQSVPRKFGIQGVLVVVVVTEVFVLLSMPRGFSSGFCRPYIVDGVVV
ncbi:hypothetical protein NQ315_014014 [Exocentrus adspersus]|uniref:Reverse transcriptase domain-containing protein n=1 Tax=Exocentrus adspersus TaxID=1586481 RepID=A0AAV8V6E8_9CUCU|nr:hypothetical protein NQ315_014014 [Exocentrus adspersus]